MSGTSACLLILLLSAVMQYVQCQVNHNDPNLIVRCYTGTLCQLNGRLITNGSNIRAGDCCTGLGNSLRTPPGGEAGDRCFMCIAAGFKQSSLTISGVNTSHAITVVSTTFDEQLDYDISFQLQVTALDRNRPLDQILNMQKYDVPEIVRLLNTDREEDIVLRIGDGENNLALEEDARYSLELLLVGSTLGTATHLTNGVLSLYVVDPDVVSVKFEQESYTFSESNGTAVIGLVRTGATASDFNINITCERLFGSALVSFPSSLDTSEIVPFSFIIPNDNLGLQGSRTDTLTISSVSDSRVTIESPSTTLISITDDEVLYAGFQQSLYTFSESVGRASLTVTVSGSIAKTLQLRVRGGPNIQPPTVQISGTVVNEIVEFIPGGSRSAVVSFSVTDDTVALETTEAYILVLEVVGDEDVVIGDSRQGIFPSVSIQITDDDTASIETTRLSHTVSEADGSVDVCAILSNPLVIAIQLTFSTSDITALDPDDYLGGRQVKSIQPRETTVCATYQIQQDNLVEGNEDFSVSIGNLSPGGIASLSFGQQLSTTITIIDSNEVETDPVCNREIDILFVLDSSGSIGINNYTTMLSFASEVASGFEFGSAGAQFGVVTFANSASLDISLGEFTNPTSFARALMQVEYKAAKTNTAEALMLATRELRDNGRQEVPHVIIILTDGQSDDPQATQTQAALARNQGIRLLSVGIGPKIDLNELNGISTDPDKDHVFLISDFSESSFSALLAPLVRETCELLVGFSSPVYEVNEQKGFLDVSFEVLNGTINRNIVVDFSFTSGTAEENKDFTGIRQSFTLNSSISVVTVRFNIVDDSQPEDIEFFTASISTSDEFVKVTVPTARVSIIDDDDESCNEKVDIMVVIDSSDSVSLEEFDTTKEFIYKFASEFVFESNSARFGVVTYSASGKVNIKLGEFGTSSQFERAVSQIVQLQPGATNTAVGIRLATDEFIERGRTGVPKVMLVIIDGNSNSREATLQAAARARALGIEIIVIGISAFIDEDEIYAIATDPDRQHVFLLENLSSGSLNTIKKPLTERICEPMCKRAVDIVFAVDSSSTIGTTNFNSIRQFLSLIVSRYVVGPEDAQFGVVRFSTSASTVITLRTHPDLSSLRAAINGISYVPGETNIAEGIEFAIQELTVNGRRGVPKVLIIITDGGSVSSGTIAVPGGTAKSLGIEIFPIGIGDSVDIEELNVFATDPDSDHVFPVASFDSGLLAVSSRLVRGTCNVPACTTPLLDIVFAIDSSGSIGAESFTNLLNFVADVIDQYNIGADLTRTGIIRFSSSAEILITLGQFSTKQTLITEILGIAYLGGGTSTDLAIDRARDEFRKNGRSTAKHILIVLTDGQSRIPGDTLSQAQLAKSEGIEIFSVGIGSGVNINELNGIASDPDSTHVLTVSDFSAASFASIIQQLNQGICTDSLTCSREAEVVFVIDASQGDIIFNNIKQFIIETVSEVDISQTATRVSVVQFSSTANIAIRLTDANDHQSLISRLAQLASVSGSRNLASAIRLAELEIQGVGRIGVARIIFVITSGPSDDLQLAADAAQSAQDNNILVVGIGNSISSTELKTFVPSRLIFTARDIQLSGLRTFRDNIVDIMCSQEPQCHLDLLFLLDSSSSVLPAEFQSSLEFIVRIIRQYDIGTTGTQVGIVAFSSVASAEAPFAIRIGSIVQKELLIQTVLSLQQLDQSGRRTDLALNLAREHLTSFRNDAPNIVILLTTGISDNSQLTLQAAERLQVVSDTEVLVVGASDGSDADSNFLDEIFAIGSDPDTDHVFRLNSFQRQSFNTIFQPVIEEFCDDDSNVQKDPMFTVPINRGLKHGNHNLELCYEIYGEADKYLNLLSDECISVNAHYSDGRKLSKSGRTMHFIDQVAIVAANNVGHCINIVIEMDAKQCSVSANGAVMTFDSKNQFKSAGVNVTFSSSNRVIILVPNCDQKNVLMIATCKTIGNEGFIEFQIQDGIGIKPSAHGLIGQFWNIPMFLSSVITVSMRVPIKDDIKVLEIHHPLSPVRYVPAWMTSSTWSSKHTACLYAGDTQGGHVYEVKSPNDTLLEGSYKDYIVPNLFATGFKYKKFNDNVCN